MLFSCNNIKKSFATDDVLKNISFNIEEKEKVAIVGVNGAGKTTLFRIITNEMSADSGEIVFPKDFTMGYMSQVSDLNEDNTIYEELITVFEYIITLEQTLREMEVQMSGINAEELENLMKKYSELSTKYEELNSYEYKSRIRGVIKGLGFADEESEQTIKTLSGGQKTRVSLAKLLLKNPDLLLLDEPTNHLDIESVQWLEDFLKNYNGSILIISHDRYFMDKTVSKIIEIEHGLSKVYNGNYSFFAHKKEIDRDIAMRHYINSEREIKRQEDIIKKLKSFNREKSIKRAESREKLLEKIERAEQPENLPDKMRLKISPKKESGNDVMFVEELSKSFDGGNLFQNISFDIKKGEKIALIGANGIGKTTILRIILNMISSDSGAVKLGSNVEIGYYDQEHENISDEKTIFQEIYDSYPKLTVGEIRNILAAFIFTGDDVFKPISTLSGGERGRVALAKIMLSNANFLILDEPTNHLDIFSKEILEETLRNYTATILYISHDRYFINNTAEKIIELTNDKAIVYDGNYDYYLEKRSILVSEGIIEEDKLTENKQEWKQKKETLAEERRLKNLIKKLEEDIENKENEIANFNLELETEEVFTNHELAAEIFSKKTVAEEELIALYEKWEEAGK